jgi:hypothetical protein
VLFWKKAQASDARNSQSGAPSPSRGVPLLIPVRVLEQEELRRKMIPMQEVKEIMAKTNSGFRSNKAEMVKVSVALMAGLLIAAPAFAQNMPQTASPQTTSPSQQSVEKQPTDGGDSPSNPRATDAAAAEWHKQHIDGGDSPSDPRATDASAAEWRKQHPYAQ